MRRGGVVTTVMSFTKSSMTHLEEEILLLLLVSFKSKIFLFKFLRPGQGGVVGSSMSASCCLINYINTRQNFLPFPANVKFQEEKREEGREEEGAPPQKLTDIRPTSPTA